MRLFLLPGLILWPDGLELDDDEDVEDEDEHQGDGEPQHEAVEREGVLTIKHLQEKK